MKKNEFTFSDQSGDPMYDNPGDPFINSTKYKSSCLHVFYKIALLKFLKKLRSIPVMEYWVSKGADLSAILLSRTLPWPYS